MKTLSLVTLSVLLVLTSNAQAPWQKDKTYHPFVDGVASIQKDGHTAVAFETGILNKNTLFKVGIGTGSWEESQTIIVVGASRRIFTINRFETWGLISTTFGVTHRVDNNVGAQIVEIAQIDKVLSFLFTLGTHKDLEHYSQLALQYGFGLRLTLGRGNVHSSY